MAQNLYCALFRMGIYASRGQNTGATLQTIAEQLAQHNGLPISDTLPLLTVKNVGNILASEADEVSAERVPGVVFSHIREILEGSECHSTKLDAQHLHITLEQWESIRNDGDASMWDCGVCRFCLLHTHCCMHCCLLCFGDKCTHCMMTAYRDNEIVCNTGCKECGGTGCKACDTGCRECGGTGCKACVTSGSNGKPFPTPSKIVFTEREITFAPVLEIYTSEEDEEDGVFDSPTDDEEAVEQEMFDTETDDEEEPDALFENVTPENTQSMQSGAPHHRHEDHWTIDLLFPEMVYPYWDMQIDTNASWERTIARAYELTGANFRVLLDVLHDDGRRDLSVLEESVDKFLLSFAGVHVRNETPESMDKFMFDGTEDKEHVFDDDVLDYTVVPVLTELQPRLHELLQRTQKSISNREYSMSEEIQRLVNNIGWLMNWVLFERNEYERGALTDDDLLVFFPVHVAAFHAAALSGGDSSIELEEDGKGYFDDCEYSGDEDVVLPAAGFDVFWNERRAVEGTVVATFEAAFLYLLDATAVLHVRYFKEIFMSKRIELVMHGKRIAQFLAKEVASVPHEAGSIFVSYLFLRKSLETFAQNIVVHGVPYLVDIENVENALMYIQRDISTRRAREHCVRMEDVLPRMSSAGCGKICSPCTAGFFRRSVMQEAMGAIETPPMDSYPSLRRTMERFARALAVAKRTNLMYAPKSDSDSDSSDSDSDSSDSDGDQSMSFGRMVGCSKKTTGNKRLIAGNKNTQQQEDEEDDSSVLVDLVPKKQRHSKMLDFDVDPDAPELALFEKFLMRSQAKEFVTMVHFTKRCAYLDQRLDPERHIGEHRRKKIHDSDSTFDEDPEYVFPAEGSGSLEDWSNQTIRAGLDKSQQKHTDVVVYDINTPSTSNLKERIALEQQNEPVQDAGVVNTPSGDVDIGAFIYRMEAVLKTMDLQVLNTTQFDTQMLLDVSFVAETRNIYGNYLIATKKMIHTFDLIEALLVFLRAYSSKTSMHTREENEEITALITQSENVVNFWLDFEQVTNDYGYFRAQMDKFALDEVSAKFMEGSVPHVEAPSAVFDKSYQYLELRFKNINEAIGDALSENHAIAFSEDAHVVHGVTAGDLLEFSETIYPGVSLESGEGSSTSIDELLRMSVGGKESSSSTYDGISFTEDNGFSDMHLYTEVTSLFIEDKETIAAAFVRNMIANFGLFSTQTLNTLTKDHENLKIMYKASERTREASLPSYIMLGNYLHVIGLMKTLYAVVSFQMDYSKNIHVTPVDFETYFGKLKPKIEILFGLFNQMSDDISMFSKQTSDHQKTYSTNLIDENQREISKEILMIKNIMSEFWNNAYSPKILETAVTGTNGPFLSHKHTLRDFVDIFMDAYDLFARFAQEYTMAGAGAQVKVVLDDMRYTECQLSQMRGFTGVLLQLEGVLKFPALDMDKARYVLTGAPAVCGKEWKHSAQFVKDLQHVLHTSPGCYAKVVAQNTVERASISAQSLLDFVLGGKMTSIVETQWHWGKDVSFALQPRTSRVLNFLDGVRVNIGALLGETKPPALPLCDKKQESAVRAWTDFVVVLDKWLQTIADDNDGGLEHTHIPALSVGLLLNDKWATCVLADLWRFLWNYVYGLVIHYPSHVVARVALHDSFKSGEWARLPCAKKKKRRVSVSLDVQKKPVRSPLLENKQPAPVVQLHLELTPPIVRAYEKTPVVRHSTGAFMMQVHALLPELEHSSDVQWLRVEDDAFTSQEFHAQYTKLSKFRKKAWLRGHAINLASVFGTVSLHEEKVDHMHVISLNMEKNAHLGGKLHMTLRTALHAPNHEFPIPSVPVFF